MSVTVLRVGTKPFMRTTVGLRRAGVQAFIALVGVLVLVAGVLDLARGTRPAAAPLGAPSSAPAVAPTIAPPATTAAVRVSRAQARRDAQSLRLDAGPRTPPAAQRAAPRPPAEALAQLRDRLLRQVYYPWADLGWTVELAGPRPGLQGLAEPRTRTISVFVRAGQSDLDLLKVLAHELGHAVDLTYGTPARRVEWRQLRGLPASTAWFPCAYCSDYASGAGDFAETFAVYLVGRHDFRSRLAAAPSGRELFDLGYLFWP